MELRDIINEIKERNMISREMEKRDAIYDCTTYGLCIGIEHMYFSGLICEDTFDQILDTLLDTKFDIKHYYDREASALDRDTFYKFLLH